MEPPAMQCITALLALLNRRATPRPRPRPVRCEPEDTEERSWGCGWFDSSHELHRGLLVQEHAASDALAAELPLRPWLELQLSGWRAAAAAGAAPTQA